MLNQRTFASCSRRSSSNNNNEGGRISYTVFQKLGLYFKMSTGNYQYFSPTTPFPSRKDTGIGALATREANGSVKHVLERQARQQSIIKSGNNIPTSQTPTEPSSANTLPLLLLRTCL